MTTPGSGDKKNIIPPLPIGTKVKLLQSINGYSFTALDVPKSVILDNNDELTISDILDTRTTPGRQENPLEAEAKYSNYKVSALKQVTERYLAKRLYKVKHTELTNDAAARLGASAYSLSCLEVSQKVYLRVKISDYPKGTEVVVVGIGSKTGPGGNPSGRTAGSSGQVTSATPITSIVYDVDVYLTKKSMIEYIPRAYLPHSYFRQA